MQKSDKQLMREGNYTEALGDNYVVKSISASIWIDGPQAYTKRDDTNVIRTKSYSNIGMLYEEELNDIIKEYPNAYFTINDANNWL